jgi:hypothetical protein
LAGGAAVPVAGIGVGFGVASVVWAAWRGSVLHVVVRGCSRSIIKVAFAMTDTSLRLFPRTSLCGPGPSIAALRPPILALAPSVAPVDFVSASTVAEPWSGPGWCAASIAQGYSPLRLRQDGK